MGTISEDEGSPEWFTQLNGENCGAFCMPCGTSCEALANPNDPGVNEEQAIQKVADAVLQGEAAAKALLFCVCACLSQSPLINKVTSEAGALVSLSSNY